MPIKIDGDLNIRSRWQKPNNKALSTFINRYNERHYTTLGRRSINLVSRNTNTPKLRNRRSNHLWKTQLLECFFIQLFVHVILLKLFLSRRDDTVEHIRILNGRSRRCRERCTTLRVLQRLLLFFVLADGDDVLFLPYRTVTRFPGTTAGPAKPPTKMTTPS